MFREEPCSRSPRHRPYRSPELLFGPRDYDARAVDLWSIGAVLAEFFTPLRLQKADDDDYYGYPEDDSGDEVPTSKEPFVVPKGVSPDQQGVEWERESLYDASRGQIGLAFSIFKVHGTPTVESWPVRRLDTPTHSPQRSLTAVYRNSKTSRMLKKSHSFRSRQ